MNKAILLILIAVLVVGYLFQVEAVIKANYTSQEYMKQLRDIEDNDIALEQESSSSISVESMEQRVATLGFVKVSEVRYIPVDYLAGK